MRWIYSLNFKYIFMFLAIFALVIFRFYDSFFENKKTIVIKKQKDKRTIIEDMKNIATYLKSKKIKEFNIKVLKQGIEIDFISSFSKSNKFIKYCEEKLNYRVINFHIVPIEKKLKTHLKIYKNRYLEKLKDTNLLKVYNPFFPNKKDKYILYAVFGDMALINNKFLKEGDMIKDFLVDRIEEKVVWLLNQKTNKRKKLRLFKDAY